MTGLQRLALCLLLAAVPFARADVRASVDHDRVSELDTVTLTLREAGGDLTGEPNLAPLRESWEVLGRQRASNIRITPQGTLESRRWVVQLQPKRTGRLMIPALTWDGAQSEPIEVEVRAERAETREVIDDLVYFDTSVSAESVWVQQQLIYTIRLYYAADVQLFGDLPSAPELPDAIVEPLGGSEPSRQPIDGTRYNVIEQRYAIFPQRSGPLELPPESLRGTIRLPEAGYRIRRKNIHVTSDGHEVAVRPQPDAWPADTPWLPAAQLTLEQRFGDGNPSFHVGKPITRTLEVRARGLAASALPPLTLPDIATVRRYPKPAATREQSRNGELRASRTETITLVPQAPGTLTVPAVSLRWWDVDTGAIQRARVPARTFRVQPAVGAMSPGGAPAPGGPGTPSADDGARAEVGTGPSSPADAASEPGASPAERSPWRLIVGGLAIASLATLGVWAARTRGRRRVRRHREPHATPPGERARFRALADACRRGDPVAARRALDAWLRAYPGRVSGRPQDALPVTDREALGPHLEALDRTLYAPAGTESWDGRGLLAWARALRRRRRPRRVAAPQLAALYP